MAKFKNGLYVGKFVAYHKGHQNCINHFSNLCENLKVVLCTKPSDRVPGNIRKTWLEQDIKQNINKEINSPEKIELYHLVEDNIPLYPEGLVQWCNTIKQLVGSVDIMFGNEDYVVDCAKLFKSEYYIPDFNRVQHQISSTKILDSQLKYYDMLNTVSKSYFNKTVLITGADRTGKSHIAKSLSKHFNSHYMEEFCRGFFENEVIKCGLHGLSNWEVSEFENLMIHQYNLFKEAKQKPHKIIFFDSDVLLTEVFSNLYIRESSSTMKNLIKNQNFDLNFLLTSDRSDDKERNTDGKEVEYIRKSDLQKKELIKNDFVTAYLRHSLKHFKKSFMEVSNDEGYDSRMSKIVHEIKSAFLI